MTDAEFLYEDGRKAEKLEIDQGKIKITEIYVEPKPEKKLAQRITEKYCNKNIQCVVRTNSDLPNKVNIFFYITVFLSSTSIIYKLFNKYRSK